MDDNFLAVDPELQRPFQNVAHLLVHVAVQRDDASLLEQDARHHEPVAHHELAVEEGVQSFDLNVLPTNVFEHDTLSKVQSRKSRSQKSTFSTFAALPFVVRVSDKGVVGIRSASTKRVRNSHAAEVAINSIISRSLKAVRSDA